MDLNMLSSVDADEVSPVRRAANRRRFLLMKGETVADAELEDMLAIPWEHEGAMVDRLRSADVDQTVQKAMVAAIRLAKSVESDLPAEMRIAIEKLGHEMYPVEKAAADDDDDAAKEPDDDADDVEKREFDAGARERDASSGKALPDGSYPIEDEGDLKNAIQAVGRAKDRGRAMAHIKARAKSLGLTKLLPDGWGMKKSDTDGDCMEPDNDTDDNGNVTKEDTVGDSPQAYAVPVQKEDGSWDLTPVPAEARPVWEAVLKSNETLNEKLAKAEEQIKKQDDRLREKEFIAKAEESFDVLAPAPELGPILKAAADGMDPEQYEKLEALLTGAAERIHKGDLFKEQGRASGVNDGSSTDAYSTAVRKANELIEKGNGMSEDEAITKVFETHPELYNDYLAEMGVN